MIIGCVSRHCHPCGSRDLASLHQPELRFIADSALRFLDIELLDAQAPLGDLVSGEAELFEVAARLAEMALQIEHALLEPADIFEKPRHLDLDDARLLAH